LRVRPGVDLHAEGHLNGLCHRGLEGGGEGLRGEWPQLIEGLPHVGPIGLEPAQTHPASRPASAHAGAQPQPDARAVTVSPSRGC
jgi:hypothetical protein